MVWDQNVARVRVNRESCMALWDNGMQNNTIIPGFIENHSLDIGPLSDLIGRWVTCVGLGNAFTWPIGYIIIQAQVDRVQGYDKDQIALVILDLSSFVAWVPVNLGTPMISHFVNMIKKREIDTLVTPWVNAWVPYLLAVWCAAAMVEDKFAVGVSDPIEYDKVVTTKDTKMIDAFSSHIIHVRTRNACMDVRLSVMTQDLCAEDGSLPQGLTIQNVYTEMHNGSKNVTIIVRNSTAYLQTLRKKIPGGKSSCSHTGARATDAAQNDKGIQWGPQHPDTKVDHEAKAGKTVWEVRFG